MATFLLPNSVPNNWSRKVALLPNKTKCKRLSTADIVLNITFIKVILWQCR